MNTATDLHVLRTAGLYESLMGLAADPADLATLAIAGAVTRSWMERGRQVLPIVGIDAQGMRALFDRCFPAWQCQLAIDWNRARPRLAPGFEEDLIDLLGLLLDHASGPRGDSQWMAHTVATGCLGRDHLWQDMGLPSRRELSALLQKYFRPLAAKNTGDMKWKKFFYKQLCERAEVFVCKAPSCGVCVDYKVCFGPETADQAAWRSRQS